MNAIIRWQFESHLVARCLGFALISSYYANLLSAQSYDWCWNSMWIENKLKYVSNQYKTLNILCSWLSFSMFNAEYIINMIYMNVIRIHWQFYHFHAKVDTQSKHYASSRSYNVHLSTIIKRMKECTYRLWIFLHG